MDSIFVFVPSYNAEAHLEKTIERISGQAWKSITAVWIINDGSTDFTAKVISRLQDRNPKIRSVSFERNRGYGEAVKEGLRRAKKGGAGYTVCLHADGQYAPEKLMDMVGAAIKGGYDILQGSRHAAGTARKGGMPYYKIVAGKMLTCFENLALGLSLTDYHSGYLCYSRQALASIPFEQLSTDFVFDLEMIASARARGLRVGEIPIPTRYADEISHLRPVQYGLRVLWVMLRYLRGKY